MSAAVQQISSVSTPFNTDGLTPIQIQVAAALALGRSITAAAEAAGIHRTTIHGWLRASPEFQRAVDLARHDHAAAVADQLHELSSAALATLRDLLTNPQTNDAVRLRAALAVLDRPQPPFGEWSLPADVLTEKHREIIASLAEIQAAEIAEAAARNAPCPCGSGVKYKRCCGRNAPPQ